MVSALLGICGTEWRAGAGADVSTVVKSSIGASITAASHHRPRERLCLLALGPVLDLDLDLFLA